MAISGYLMNADQDQVKAFNGAVMKKAGLHFGIVLKPTSSTRAYISIDNLKQVRTALGESEFQKLQKSTKISVLDEIEETDAKALIESRDPEDITEQPGLEQPPSVDPATGMKLDWHLVEAGIGAAWAMLGGPADIPWKDVAVGHIDTGFTTNPALGFKADVSDWVDTAADRNFFQKELIPLEGAPPTFATQDSALDNLGGFSGGHGTRTMSVLCGFNETAAAKKGGYDGYYGAAPRVRVIPIRIENTIFIQNTFRESLPAAIHYLVDQGVGVISLSMGAPKFGVLGTDATPKALGDAIDRAYERGVIFCCAAGNNVPDEKVVFPARCARTIAVAGSSCGLTEWKGSSYGRQVDISAPAFPIRRARYPLAPGKSMNLASARGHRSPHRSWPEPRPCGWRTTDPRSSTCTRKAGSG